MLPEGYIENYEQIAKDFGVGISDETLEMVDYTEAICNELKMSKNAKVLDLGCGVGFVIGRSLWTSCRIGLDISHTQCKAGSKLFRSVNFLQADAQEIPFRDNSFDMAICTDLFEHVPDEKKLSDEIYRVLNRDGLLVFACPFEQDLSYYDSPNYEKKYRYVHLRSVSWEMLNKCFSRFIIFSQTSITSHMAKQKSPYPIIFRVYTKRRM